jgi:Uma2 family endonuclease
MMAQISDEHDEISGLLIAMLTAFCQAHDLGTIRHDPFQMKTGPKLPGRAPDVLFVSKKNAHRLKRLYVDGPADLVVEIISMGSRSVDRGAKYGEYEQGGVKEYWLIDPERKHAEFNGLGRDGTYQLLPTPDGVFRSTVMKGLWLRVDWLWKRPPLMQVLKDWKLV